MRILSFDIGIKNLAFCDVGDVHIMKPIKSEDDIDGVTTEKCDADLYASADSNVDVNVEVACDHPDPDSKDSLNYPAQQEYPTRQEYPALPKYEIHDWQVLDISTVEKKYDINKVIEVILTKLDALFRENIHLYDAVLIENQPVLKNPIMKSIQMIIFTYFHMMRREKECKTITHKHPTINPSQLSLEIHLISACNKCKSIRQLPKERAILIQSATETESKSNKGYKFNKKMAHNISLAFLDTLVANREEKMDMYLAHKKRDDLADSFLQATYFMGEASGREEKDMEKKKEKEKKKKEKKEENKNNGG